MIPESSPLPFTDTKPTGAADFYFAINATFRFIQKRLGQGFGIVAFSFFNCEGEVVKFRHGMVLERESD